MKTEGKAQEILTRIQGKKNNRRDLNTTEYKKDGRAVYETQNLYEGNVFKNALSNAKKFIGKSISNIRKNAKKILNQLKRDFLGSKSASNFQPGKMLAMNYKAKDTKKRFDKNPLIICLGAPRNKKLQKTHTLGLNMHWMQMSDRVKLASFFVELLKKRNGELTYDDVKPFISKFKGSPILRMYIIKNIGPKVIEMPTDQFMMASAIPSEKWA